MTDYEDEDASKLRQAMPDLDAGALSGERFEDFEAGKEHLECGALCVCRD